MAKKKKTTQPVEYQVVRSESLDKLAIYNAECARGIVHTPEWDQLMAERQARFEEQVAREAALEAEIYIMRAREARGLPTEQVNWLGN